MGKHRRMRSSPSRCTFLNILSFWSLVYIEINTIEGTKPLHFQLLVSQNKDADFSGYIPAVDLALSLINDNSSILPEYELKYTDIIDPQVR